MHEVTISDTNWERLKKWGDPLIDTPNVLLTKVLDIAESIPVGLSDKEKEEINTELSEERNVTGYTKDKEVARRENSLRLLEIFEQWLQSKPDIRLKHSKKTMNTYELMPVGDRKGKPAKLYVPTNGQARLYLPITNYRPVDPTGKVIYKDQISKNGTFVGWNVYPQFVLRNEDDLDFAKKLIEYAVKENREESQ